jgi:hypothetical protein
MRRSLALFSLLAACSEPVSPARDASIDRGISPTDAAREGSVALDASLDAAAHDSAPSLDVIADAPSAIDASSLDSAASDSCVPRTCETANCGTVSDGCGRMLLCGSCADPEVCGADHRCARPAPLPYPTRTPYRIKSLQPDFWADRSEVIGNNTGGIAVNLVWAQWQPSDRRAPCAASEVTFDGRCFVVKSNVDAEIRAYTAAGLVVTAVVYGSPAWSRAGQPCTPAGPGFDWFCPPTSDADFARFAAMIARRYDGNRSNGRIADFVIWNEVNSNDWFDIGCGQGGGPCDSNAWISRYARLYNAAYDAITAEQPTARVLFSFEHHFGRSFDNPSASSPLLSVETFLTGLAPLVAPRAWSVAYHPYPPDLLQPQFSPDDWPRVTYGNLGAIVQFLRARFPTVPSAWTVELTESGVNSLGPNSSPSAQATGVCDSFRNVLGTPGIDNYVYHRMVDHPAETAAGLGVGLRNSDRSAKPAWSVWALANRNDLVPPMLSCGFEELPYTRLRRSYNGTRGHWASSRVAPSGFATEQSWRLWREPRAGAVLLYECKVAQHNLLTRDVNCEGLQMLGPVGYVATAPEAGLVPLYRCRVGAGTDHFVSTSAACEGQTMEQLLGYVNP